MYPQIETISLRVVCPCHSPRSCIVYVLCIVGEDGNIILSQSNGCDHMTGADVCKQCSLFIHDYINDPEHIRERFPGFQVVK